MTNVCPYCDGKGCSECDGTGRRYRVGLQTEDGITIAVSGSGDFNPELIDAFKALATAAVEHMREVDADACSCGHEKPDGRGDVLRCPVHGPQRSSS